MGIGDDVKSAVDNVRDMMGTAMTINGSSIGICSYADLSPRETQSLGLDFSDEVALPWVRIEVAASVTVKEGDEIVIPLTGHSWIVRRVTDTQAAGVLIGKRCFCVGGKLI